VNTFTKLKIKKKEGRERKKEGTKRGEDKPRGYGRETTGWV